jgi:transcriptional regulator of arginine metabolism
VKVESVEARQQMILAVVGSEAVRTQEELVDALAARGMRVSQATVSRDIAALQLRKSAGRYVPPDREAAPDDPLRARIRDNLLEIRTAGQNLLVLLTPPGEASGLALALDRLALPGAVGTIAGDDTVFLAVVDARSGRDLARELRAI